MEAKFPMSFLFVIIIAAVNLQLALSTEHDSPKCPHELEVEINTQSEPVHCQHPSQDLTILVQSGFIYVNVTTCKEVTLFCMLNQPIAWSYEGLGVSCYGLYFVT